MAVSTTKKALVRRFDREPLAGFLHPHEYQQPSGVQILTPAGAVVSVPYAEIKTVCFVRDWDAPAEPSRIFHTRPKMEGLWIRMTFRDGELMDGILPNNLLLWDIFGYSVIPPEPYANNQKVFIPRQALQQVQVLGVVGSPLTRKRTKAAADEQISLFE